MHYKALLRAKQMYTAAFIYKLLPLPLHIQYEVVIYGGQRFRTKGRDLVVNDPPPAPRSTTADEPWPAPFELYGCADTALPPGMAHASSPAD